MGDNRQKSSHAQRSLSLAMIVKDEGDHLADCLSSVKPIVDEIVVVDTGSSDNTVEIARRFGAKTVTFAWCGDFSAARNESLRQATGGWILVLDADEIVAPEDLPRIRSFVDRDEFDAIQFLLANYSDDCQSMWWTPVEPSCSYAKGFSGYIRVPLVRMWRNRSEYRFHGRVHETIVESIRNAGGKIAETDILIHHYGKDRKAQDKRNLYLELGERNASERPTDPKSQYDFAVQLKGLGRLDDAERYYRRALALDPKSLLAQSGLVQVLVRSGKLDEAEAMLESMETAGAPPTVSVNLAIVYMNRGRLTAAMEKLRAALEKNPRDVVGFIHLGKLQERFGNVSSAKKSYRKALDLCPAFAPARTALNAFERRVEAKKLVESGDSLSALKVLKDALKEDPADAITYVAIGSVLMSLGQTDAAYRMLLKGLECEPRLTVVRERLKEVAAVLGKFEEAEQALAKS